MESTITPGGLLDKQDLVKNIIQPTRRRNRFFNSLLDGIFFGIIFYAIFALLLGGVVASSPDAASAFASMIVWIYLLEFVVFIGYYVFFEYKFGKTIGKMVTNTKVVNADGSKPTLGQIVGRSFARLIPFEAFSMLFSHLPRGWHDTLSGTMVVDDIALYQLNTKKTEGE